MHDLMLCQQPLISGGLIDSCTASVLNHQTQLILRLQLHLFRYHLSSATVHCAIVLSRGLFLLARECTMK